MTIDNTARTVTFDDLREANLKRADEWVPIDKWSLSDRLVELQEEVGELCGAAKRINRIRAGVYHKPTTEDELRQRMAEELADVLICADLVGAALGVDLSAAIVSKFNATTDKHERLTVKL
ncbi:MAG: hypothetical protein AAF432_00640 [Planctomycetota bacterium]